MSTKVSAEADFVVRPEVPAARRRFGRPARRFAFESRATRRALPPKAASSRRTPERIKAFDSCLPRLHGRIDGALYRLQLILMNTTARQGRLSGKRAVVTAGAQGIGLAVTRALLEAGCVVFVHYHSSAEAARSLVIDAAAGGQRCGSCCADLTSTEACEELITEAVSFLGGIDILINNAGALVERRSLAAADDDFWSEVMSLNLGSLRRVSRAAAPHLIAAAAQHGGASVVNLSSLAGRKGGHAGSLAYSTAKGAVLTFTRALAAELGTKGIRVNAVAPGLILGTRFHTTHTAPESVQATIAGIPLGRAGSPEDVARAVVFLAGEWDGFITGATLDINGGVWMG
jgi:3-oxoacyl-[acyl-carrier protein] reductase